MTKDRAVLTLAVGRPIYVQMAVNLARSFVHWHRGSDIRFLLATDRPELLPADVRRMVEVVPLAPNQYGDGFSPKLHIDRITPAARTLFVDADCLCTGSLDGVFDRFAGHAVSVVGGAIADGEWFGDVASVCAAIGVARLLKFNGGLYYVERGPRATAIYDTARSLEPRYDGLGLRRLRGKANEELLMAMAMALHGERAVPDDGSVLADPQAAPVGMAVDVLRGRSTLVNPPAGHPRHQAWYPLGEVHPLLVHFLDAHVDAHPYRREALRLELVVARRWPLWLADVWAAGVRSLPLLGRRALTNALRPMYRKLFGTRPVSASARA